MHLRFCGLFVLVGGLCLLGAQDAAQSSTQRNPFEPVPEPSQPLPARITGPPIKAIEFRGARRLPQSTLRAIIATRIGGAYDLETLRRDSEALYRTGRFSNVAWETEMDPSGAAIRFVVVERPLIQSIEFQGDEAVTISEIEERFQERKVNLRLETLYNDHELGRAVATLQELLAERGRRNITVTPLVESIWPHSTVGIVFRVSETDRAKQ